MTTAVMEQRWMSVQCIASRHIPGASTRIITCGSCCGRCRSSMAFLGVLVFHPPLHSTWSYFTSTIDNLTGRMSLTAATARPLQINADMERGIFQKKGKSVPQPTSVCLEARMYTSEIESTKLVTGPPVSIKAEGDNRLTVASTGREKAKVISVATVCVLSREGHSSLGEGGRGCNPDVLRRRSTWWEMFCKRREGKVLVIQSANFSSSIVYRLPPTGDRLYIVSVLEELQPPAHRFQRDSSHLTPAAADTRLWIWYVIVSPACSTLSSACLQHWLHIGDVGWNPGPPILTSVLCECTQADTAARCRPSWLLSYIVLAPLVAGYTTRGSKLDLRSHLTSTQETVAPFEFRAGLEIEMKTKIKLDPSSELGSFDLGSGKMLVQPGISDLHRLSWPRCRDEGRMERCRNARAGEGGDPRGQRHLPALLPLAKIRPGIESDLPWWGPSSFPAQPPRPLPHCRRNLSVPFSYLLGASPKTAWRHPVCTNGFLLLLLLLLTDRVNEKAYFAVIMSLDRRVHNVRERRTYADCALVIWSCCVDTLCTAVS
ncbi:hypothetical protein PR048_029724 [Dryococelus australis]|uniref:Uncharacterized protein n=1 Tax=Dryococelus australis TaxID=614101 RepID=A0ABQ9GE74_9NEOP|nr:hypothetical protein PR048_029724 [Dryococelus australis]